MNIAIMKLRDDPITILLYRKVGQLPNWYNELNYLIDIHN